MKHLIPYILFLSVLCAISLFASMKAREGFQSAGTLLQLETSHVPTRAEIRDRQHWLRERVSQDLYDLTGSD
jgi:hypothetical protein